MNIDEAIVILDSNLKTYPHLEHENFGVAIKLGREALELVQHYRVAHPSKCTDALPGETK